MNGKQTVLAAILMLTGVSAAMADNVMPAWQSDGFVLEEIVVSVEAPASFYMEEIVVTAEAPAHLYMEEVVVVAKRPAILDEEKIVATTNVRQQVNSRALTGNTGLESEPAAVMEEIVVSAHLDAVSNQIAMRPRNSRNRWHF
jgi:hypothetical protein